MPNWLTSGEMDEKTVDVMARYIQQDPPVPPEFGMAQMKATWKVIVPPAQRPTKKMNAYNIDNIFSTTLRDTGEVALIDGDTQEDHQHRQDRLRGAHLAHLGLGALPVRDRARRQDQHDRPVDGNARQRGRGAHRPRGALGRHQQVQGLRGQAGDRRRLLAAAVRDHEGRHAGAAEDRQHPRHGRRHAGIPPRAARGRDRRVATSSPSSSSTSRRPARR